MQRFSLGAVVPVWVRVSWWMFRSAMTPGRAWCSRRSRAVRATKPAGPGWVGCRSSAARGQNQDHQEWMPKTPLPTRITHLPQPIEQRRRHRQRVSSHRIQVYRAGSEFRLPQGQIGEVVNNRADRGR